MMNFGLTLVGFGTSTPELVTSLQAALSGSSGIAIGNVIGSNIGVFFPKVLHVNRQRSLVHFDCLVIVTLRIEHCGEVIEARRNRRMFFPMMFDEHALRGLVHLDCSSVLPHTIEN